MDQTFNFRNEIQQFVVEAEDFLKHVADSLNWDVSHCNKTQDIKFTFCPINNEHLVSEANLNQHIEMCHLKNFGYSKDDTFLEEIEPHLKEHPSVVRIDKYKQQKIFIAALKKSRQLNIGTHLRDPPLTFDRFLYEFTPDERYTLYDYVIQQTSQHRSQVLANTATIGCDTQSEVKGSQEPQTLKDLLAAERDAKRRRQAYRKKNPEAAQRKSDTETLRELIQSQMEFFYNSQPKETSGCKLKDTEVQWRVGHRLNVSNFHRQWEVIQERNAFNRDIEENIRRKTFKKRGERSKTKEEGIALEKSFTNDRNIGENAFEKHLMREEKDDRIQRKDFEKNGRNMSGKWSRDNDCRRYIYRDHRDKNFDKIESCSKHHENRNRSTTYRDKSPYSKSYTLENHSKSSHRSRDYDHRNVRSRSSKKHKLRDRGTYRKDEKKKRRESRSKSRDKGKESKRHSHKDAYSKQNRSRSEHLSLPKLNDKESKPRDSQVYSSHNCTTIPDRHSTFEESADFNSMFLIANASNSKHVSDYNASLAQVIDSIAIKQEPDTFNTSYYNSLPDQYLDNIVIKQENDSSDGQVNELKRQNKRSSSSDVISSDSYRKRKKKHKKKTKKSKKSKK